MQDTDKDGLQSTLGDLVNQVQATEKVAEELRQENQSLRNEIGSLKQSMNEASIK